MPTFIKTGFWDKLSKAPKEYLNLNLLIESLTPTPTYKVYTALLTQSGEDAPVATIMENTLGELVWTRTSDGIYGAIFSEIFPINKSIGFITIGLGVGAFYSITVGEPYQSSNIALVVSYNSPLMNTPQDNLLYSTPIEIRVYN